jgi:hypothetical protein
MDDGPIEFRDVRPDGVIISSWLCAPGSEYGKTYPPGERPSPPWERQRREPGGEWTAISRVLADGSAETG